MIPMITKDFHVHLRRAMQSLKLTCVDIAKLTNMPVHTFYEIFKQRSLPTLYTVQRILAKTPISYEELVGIPWMIK